MDAFDGQILLIADNAAKLVLQVSVLRSCEVVHLVRQHSVRASQVEQFGTVLYDIHRYQAT